MPAVRNSQEALARVHMISEELAGLYRELAMVKAQSVQAHTAAYQQYSASGQLNVTTVREECRSATSMFDAQAIRTQGEIDALLMEWRYLDAAILNFLPAKGNN